MADGNLIKFALYHKSWDYERGNHKTLKKEATEVTTTEYTAEMEGKIFCPECCVNLFKSPKNKPFDTNGRKAFFVHSSKFKPECGLRVKKAEGKKFATEELARKAIEDEKLVVVKEFMKVKPKAPLGSKSKEYQGQPVEDINGELTEVAISRHNGENFKLPSRITTIRGLCRNFSQNIHKYFHFPNKANAILLQDLLVDIRTVKEEDSSPKLYFGKVKSSYNCGPTPQNIRQTMFEYPRNSDCVDFCLKATDESSQEHGIDDDAKGKIVLMYGKVTESGIGLCIENIGWGELAVLPEKYEHLLSNT